MTGGLHWAFYTYNNVDIQPFKKSWRRESYALLFKMRTSLAFGLLNLSVIVAAACISEDDVKYNRLPNPLELFRPGQSTSQCDMLGDVPFGIVPQGCADLEILYGMFQSWYLGNFWLMWRPARGTGEPGNLGMVVGDPVVARVQRDLPNVIVHGYPVQVRTT